MAVSIEEARHVARLARLGLSNEALDELASELSRVLEHFESVAQCAAFESEGDTTGPLQALGRMPLLRPDECGAMLSRNDALANAPVAEDGQFSVPAFLSDEP